MDLLISRYSMVIFLLILLCGTSHGAKILLLPVTAGSHTMTFQQLGAALAERGHSLHAVANEDCKSVKKLTKVGIINHGYKVPLGCLDENPELKKQQLQMQLRGFSIWQLSKLTKTMGRFIGAELSGVLNENIFKELKKENFDLAIVDAIMFTRPMYIIPYRLGIPVISVGAVNNLLDMGIPALPSFTPTIREGKFTNKMTFIERVHNTLLSTLMDTATGYFMAQDNYVTEFAPEMPYKSLTEIQASTVLWLIMNDITIDYPQVGLPHVINIGGINTGPAKPLTTEFQAIADGAKDGLIIVSFGSSVSDFPPEIRTSLYNDLKHVKQTIIWRYTGEVPKDVPPNMHLVSWMPQNDLLAHANTKVFVTHCGCNGQFEALYNGIAMVGIPIFGDQRYNGIRMADKGMGVNLGRLDFEPGQLQSAIAEVMHNGSYTQVMKKYSAIFRSTPMTPIDRAMYWVDHVLEYGHEHLRSSAVDMPWYQYWCIDVLVFVSFIVSLAITLFVLTVCFVVRKCRSCFRKKKNDAAKVKSKRQ